MFAGESVLAIGMLTAVVIADGFAPVPEQSTIFRRSPLGAWSIRKPFRVAGRWSWAWRPFVWTSVVCESRNGAADPARSTARHWRLVSARVTLMQSIAALQAIGLLVGVPLVTLMHGIVGFALSMLGVIYLGFLQGLLAGPIVGRLTGSWRAGLGAGLRCLWPFTSLRAADRVLDAAGIDARCILRVAGPGIVLDAYRAALYDAASGSENSEGEFWLSLIGRDRVRSYFGETSAPPGTTVCPRCASQYVAERAECVECGIPLR